MAKERKGRRDGLRIEAVNPRDGKRCEVLISHARMQAVATRSMGHAKECAYIVPEILQSPTSTFEGLRREEDEDPRGVGWLCYCGIPLKSYRADGSEGKPYHGQVYLVFVNDEGVAYNWRWEKADPDDPRLPIDHEARFKTRLL
jgi:hypothetical protein